LRVIIIVIVIVSQMGIISGGLEGADGIELRTTRGGGQAVAARMGLMFG
jgi:hypothetical protein